MPEINPVQCWHLASHSQHFWRLNTARVRSSRFMTNPWDSTTPPEKPARPCASVIEPCCGSAVMGCSSLVITSVLQGLDYNVPPCFGMFLRWKGPWSAAAGAAFTDATGGRLGGMGIPFKAFGTDPLLPPVSGPSPPGPPSARPASGTIAAPPAAFPPGPSPR